MTKVKLPIKDSLFAHNSISSFWNESEFIEWDRTDDNVKDYVFLTDSDVHTVDSYHNKKKYAWLLESPDVTPEAYKYVETNSQKFDKIFTFDSDFLKLNNSLFLPFGGTMLDKSDIKIHEKNKNLSMMFSWKRNLTGHKLRHDIYRDFKGKIDFYGSGYNGVNEKKIVSTKDYRFSVAIENCKKDYYFTEKIIDCCLTGTIPIYWGCPSIGDYFDINGIITLNHIEELNEILPSINEDLYNKMRDGIVNNFNIAKKFMIAEDYLFNNYTKLII